MDKKLRKFLEANGLRQDATEAQAWRHYDTLKSDGVEYQGEIGSRSAAAAPAEQNQPAATPVQEPQRAAQLDPSIQSQIDEGVRQARAADITLRAEIDDRLRVAGLDNVDNGDFRRSIIGDATMTSERATTMIFEKMQKQNPSLGSGTHSGFEVGAEASDKFRNAVSDGLMLRTGIRLEKPAEGCREFRSRPLHEIMRESLELQGTSTRGMSRDQVVSRALAAGSSSDFPLILSGLVSRHLLAAYQAWPATWRPFTAIGDATDFKNIHGLKMSESPDLKGLNENGEYQTASFSEAGENYRVITKGIKVPLTRVMIINDDLRAFTRIPRLFGASAKRMEADAVYSLITTNGAMSDSVALFHADHKNLATGDGIGAVSSTTLAANRAAMRRQKGLNGVTIDVTPAFLLAPVEMETDADILLRSAALPTADMSSGVHNPWANKLTPITDPHLTGDPWYLFAHPDQYPVIEAAYLEGEEEPFVDEMVDFNSDSLIIKVRHDFGAGVVDHVGAYKNAGS